MKIRNTGLRIKRFAQRDLQNAKFSCDFLIRLKFYRNRPWIAVVKQTHQIVADAQTKQELNTMFSCGIKRARRFFKYQRTGGNR